VLCGVNSSTTWTLMWCEPHSSARRIKTM